MGIFDKKEEVPSIPEIPKLPDLPEQNQDEMKLPELPPVPKEKLPKPTFQQLGEQITLSSNKSKKEFIPKIPPKPLEKRTLEISPELQPSQQPQTRQTEPIFVRIDKFQTSQKNFTQIKEKVSEIESALKKTKQEKEKEDEEISAWQEDIEKIKSRLSEIDSEIFEQI